VLEVRLGGGLALRANGSELALPASRRARALLAYLALNPGPQRRAQLAARFWPDVLDESARTSLRVALSELRRALGPAAGHLVATRETVALDGPDLSIDTRAFAQALADSDAAAALAACSVPILADLDEDWAEEARREHLHRLEQALEQAAAGSADRAEAVRLTRAQVALDPLAEAPNRRLIERLAAAGDRAAALAAGRQFADRLRAELSIAPSRETRELLDELRRGAAAPVRPPASLARAGESEFVGRRRELDRLRASWGGMQMHGDRRVVLLAGEPGIGKTRLAYEFARAALEDGATVLLGRCSEEPLEPFEPFAEALRQAGLADALRPGDPDDVGARHRLFGAVDTTFADLAAHAPVVMLLDDLHWADRATLLLLSFLMRSSRPGPLLLLGTYRDTELGRVSPLTAALAELQRAGGLDRIVLHGLATEDVAALARSLLGTDDAALRVHDRTNGNAFFVEEVLHSLAESSVQDVPESVRHVVGLRLTRMSEDAGTLLAAAAILGLEHDARALQATAELEPVDAEAALDEILRARLLRPSASPPRFEFSHALVREAVLDEQNVLRRARLHHRAAEALIALGEERHLEEIALHLFEAATIADAGRAAEMSMRAGRRALERLAYEDAAEHFTRAREAFDLAGVESGGGAALLARGDALLRAGEPDAARAAFTAARDIALRTGDNALLAESALGFAGLGIAILDLDGPTIARLEEALERVDDDVLRSRLQARLAVELYYAPDRARSEELSAAAVATARNSGDVSALASALGARHVALWRPDRVAERIAVAGEMIAAASDARERHAELQARNWLVVDLFELGDMGAWREEMARHARLADELRLPTFQWYTPLWAAVEAMLAGRFDEMERLCAEAEGAGKRAGDRNAELFPGLIRFCAQVEREAYDEMNIAFVEDKIANSPAGPAYRGGYTWVLAGLGRHEEARSQLDAAIAHPHAFDANWLSLQAECAETSILLGVADHAELLYERLAPYAGRPATAGRAVCSYGAVDRALGGLAALLGREDDAVAHLGRAIRRNEEMGCVSWRERAERDLERIVVSAEQRAQQDANL
jgi:DNA-binding SARP family transcriptional activator